ncbi:MAG: hypothetical protein IPK26_21050 [Planctomycetes bacterium]|nr:hypothetical protein [Planctomycetota bacterium]
MHGPTDPRRLWLWTLDAGFAGLAAGPGPRLVDWSAWRAAASDLPVRVPIVRADSTLTEDSATAGLASARDGELAAARSAIADAVRTGQRLGTEWIVLEPGRVAVLGEVEAHDLGDPHAAWTREKAQPLLARRKAVVLGALDRVCRALYGVCKSFPDNKFALSPGRSLLTVADRAGLAAIFEDLRHLPLFYWHDAAVSARRQQVLDEEPGEALEDFSNRFAGCGLGDAGPDGMYGPPGAGGVDYGLLGSYVHRTSRVLPVVLDLDPTVDPAELPGIRSCLDKYGL